MEYNNSSSPPPPLSPRKSHRQQRKPRVSALRLSSDTTASLPEYRQATWSREEDDVPSDKPPDYPDSADEADEETELDIDDPYVPQYSSPHRLRQHTFTTPPPHTSSPRRQKRFLQQQQQQLQQSSSTNRATQHKRRHSSTAVLKSRTDTDVDTYLDNLLERSVHALEVSNTLLESSISTQATMSALFSPEYHSGTAESALEARAIGLSSTLLRSWDVQENWAEQLDRIKQGVDSLLSEEPNSTESVARSMPSGSSPLGHKLTPNLGRRPSMDQLHQSQLRYAPQDRATLVSPAPRALTMYIDANSASSPSFSTFNADEGAVNEYTEPDSSADLMLPATLGARPPQPSFFHHPVGIACAYSAASGSTSTASSSTSNLILPSTSTSTFWSPALEPQLTHGNVEPLTPAYNMLSNLAARSSAVNLNASSSTLALPLPGSSSLKSGEHMAAASAPSSFVSSFLSNMSSLRRRNSSPPPHPQTTHPQMATASSNNPNNPPSPGSTITSNSRTSRSTNSTTTNSRRHSPMQKRRSISADQHSLGSSRSSLRRGITANGNGLNSKDDVVPVIVVRHMTPPTEGTDEDAEGSSSSSDGCVAKRTVVSLRKILDEQPPPAQPPPLPTLETPTLDNTGANNDNDDNNNGGTRQYLRPPAFMPRSPAVAPSAGTSTATASISRLFTKGVHTSSTRPRNEPLRSVMKRRGGDGSSEPASLSPSPSPSPSVSNFGAIATTAQAESSGSAAVISNANGNGTNAFGISGLGTVVSRALLSASTSSVSSSFNGASPSASGSNSAQSSGFSTPKRISFATLPESYASTKPEGEAGSVERRKKRSSKSRKGTGSGRRQRSDVYNEQERASKGDHETTANTSWWASWLGGADIAGNGSGYGGVAGGRDKERVEDRITRRMGMTMGIHGGGGHLSVLDEWGV